MRVVYSIGISRGLVSVLISADFKSFAATVSAVSLEAVEIFYLCISHLTFWDVFIFPACLVQTLWHI